MAKSDEEEELPLSKSAEYLLEECRMILPGIQALFGFQLVSVFSQRFAETLSSVEQKLHLAAIILVVVAIALIMTPAAYHRETGGRQVSEKFIDISTRLVVVSMVALAIGLSIDFYLIARVLAGGILAPLLALALFVVFLVLWFLLPRWQGLQNMMRRES